ncbi:MAG: cupin domain-containing protein [Bacteroidales bacterium]|nr:cupin domain-containing protein [Bacteroidales bacterium]
MKININSEIPAPGVQMEGASKVRMKILIGPDDGSGNITMRHFFVAPGGNTPFHNHDYEHVIKVERGRGVAVDEHGIEHVVQEGQSLFVRPGDFHQFRNPYDSDFEFICIIPNPAKP